VSPEPDLRAQERVAREMAARWDVPLGAPFSLALRSYVAPAGDAAVLKVTPPEDDEADEEADALALWNGDGAVRLLGADRTRRALLIERAVPGTDISGLPEDEATAVAVRVGLRLWRTAGAPFRWIGDHVPRWLDAQERRADRPSRILIPRARSLFESLDVGRSTLVHGDFHHHNILRHADDYVAIDPKPYAADREYDVPSFLWNPMTNRLDDRQQLEDRIDAFVAAGLDEFRIRAWTVIRGSYLRPEHAEAIGALL